MQANQWYENRQELSLEDSIIARLEEDFTAIASSAEGAIQFHQEQIASLEVMQNTLRERELDAESDVHFRSALSDAMGYHLGPGRSGTYVEVLSSGRFRLIRNQELRKALSAYDDSVRKAEYLFSVFQQGQRKYESAYNRHFSRSPSKENEWDAIPTGILYSHGDIMEFDFESMGRRCRFLSPQLLACSSTTSTISTGTRISADRRTGF